MKRIAIVQSNYIPWKGYFDLINSVDEFILYDDVQYTHHDWRNRNQIKTPNGREWLSIPINTSGHFGQAINETTVSDESWPRRHWDRIRQIYRDAPYFRSYATVFEDLYLRCTEKYLSNINYRFILSINQILGIHTPLRRSEQYEKGTDRTDRLISICRQCGANTYVTGPKASAYLERSKFDEADIQLEWANYHGYPQYRQLHDPFEHGVSIVDLIFCAGENAPSYMKSFLGNFLQQELPDSSTSS